MKNAKKFLALALVLISIFAMSGCGSQTEEQNPETMEPVVWKIESAYGPATSAWTFSFRCLRK